MNKMNKKGFTLIEMLVVIAIIAVLVAIIVPTVSNSTKRAKAAADAANLRSYAAKAAIQMMEDGTSGPVGYDCQSKLYKDLKGIICKETDAGVEAQFAANSGASWGAQGNKTLADLTAIAGPTAKSE